MQVSRETQTKLMQFVHRTIKPGEAFLLARLLADRIPVLGVEAGSPWEQTLKHRVAVDDVLYSLNEYLHIPQETRKNIYLMVERIWVWRQSVAAGTSNLLFSGDATSVVDDVTGILRSVNLSDVCPVADIAADANYIYDLFKQVVAGAWSQGV